MPRKVNYGCYTTRDLFHMAFRLELSMIEEEKRRAGRGSGFRALQRLEINKLSEKKKGTSIKDLTLERFCHCIVGFKLGNLGVIQTRVEEGILLRHFRCTWTLTYQMHIHPTTLLFMFLYHWYILNQFRKLMFQLLFCIIKIFDSAESAAAGWHLHASLTEGYKI